MDQRESGGVRGVGEPGLAGDPIFTVQGVDL